MNDKTNRNKRKEKEAQEGDDSFLLTSANRITITMESDLRRFHLYLSAFILNINYLLCGVGFAWSSPVLVKLPLTDVEGSSVASMLSLGSILSPFIAGVLLNTVGRKGIVGLNAVLVTISSLVLLFAGTNVTMLIVGRLILGAMCGITFTAVPMYIAEISEETIKQNLATKTSMLSLFTLRGNLQGLVVCSTLIILQQLTGVTLLFFYSEKIIRSAGTDISSSTCSIIIGVFMLFSAFISPLSVKYFGYKKPLIASTLGMFFGMVGLGVFFLLKSNNFEVDIIGWLPLLGIVVYILFFNSGFCNIPWAMSGELFPSDIKPAATTFIAVIGGTFAFLMTNLFPELVSLLGMDFLFLTCAFFCSFALVFVMLVVHDTSGMSFGEIQDMMNTSTSKIGVNRKV